MKKKIILFWSIFILLIFSMWATKHVLEGGSLIKGKARDTVLFLASFVQNSKKMMTGENPQVVAMTSPTINGFHFFQNKNKCNGYLLISTWDFDLERPIIKLIQVKTGNVIHKWYPDVKPLIQEYNTEKFYDLQHELEFEKISLQHPFLNPDGSILFSMGGLYKIDIKDKVLWSNTRDSHHSLEKDEAGYFWICGYSLNSKIAKKYQVRDDAIVKIDGKTGKTIYEKSILTLLLENGFQLADILISPIITADKTYLDYIHLNDVEPVLEDGKFWKKGDVFFSLRHQNLVGLYRPSSNKLIWYKKGPWLKQHDVDIISPNEIAIFGNDVIDASFSSENQRFINETNQVYIYNFEKDKIFTPFKKGINKANAKTHTEGLMRVIDTNYVFIDESNKGRLHLVYKDKVIWSYAEMIKGKYLAKFNWSRLITEEEFQQLKFLE